MQVIRCMNCMEELAEGIQVCPHCGYEQDSGATITSNAVNAALYFVQEECN